MGSRLGYLRTHLTTAILCDASVFSPNLKMFIISSSVLLISGAAFLNDIAGTLSNKLVVGFIEDIHFSRSNLPIRERNSNTSLFYQT